MSSSEAIAQIATISTALLGAGANIGFSFFSIASLKSQPASVSLPTVRWLFSRGSHTIPQVCFVASSGFVYLAYAALPSAQRSILQLIQVPSNTRDVNLYLLSAALAIASAPWTQLVMLPTNFTLIKINEELGGFRSEESAKHSWSSKSGSRSARDSVNGQDEGSELSDLSGPQSRTTKDSTPEQDRRVHDLLAKFNRLNLVRIATLGASGVLGLYVALAK